jgi:hypothetical protein
MRAPTHLGHPQPHSSADRAPLAQRRPGCNATDRSEAEVQTALGAESPTEKKHPQPHRVEVCQAVEVEHYLACPIVTESDDHFFER